MKKVLSNYESRQPSRVVNFLINKTFNLIFFREEEKVSRDPTGKPVSMHQLRSMFCASREPGQEVDKMIRYFKTGAYFSTSYKNFFKIINELGIYFPLLSQTEVIVKTGPAENSCEC